MDVHIIVEPGERETPPYERLAAELQELRDGLVTLTYGPIADAPPSGWVLADLFDPMEVVISSELSPRLIPLNLDGSQMEVLTKYNLPGAVIHGVVREWYSGYSNYRLGHGVLGRFHWLEAAGIKHTRFHETLPYAHITIYGPLATVINTYLEAAEAQGGGA